MIFNMLIAATIGSAIGYYGGFIVEFIYRFKGTSKASIVRILGVSSGAVVATSGHYFLNLLLPTDGAEGMYIAIIFGIFCLGTLVISLYLRRHKIG